MVATTNNAGVGAEDAVTFQQVGNGWTAFTVSTALALPVGTNTVDVGVEVEGPPYASANTTTAYADACANGGTPIALNASSQFFPALDEGVSGNITAPTGFDFFGAAATTLRVSSNGFLAFSAITSPSPTNANMPTASAPNAVVAPFWDDLVLTGICQKTMGTKLILQWVGTTYATDEAVAFQVILDGADDTIEFVYAATQVATGATATIGVEAANGIDFTRFGFNQAGVVTPGAGRKLTFTP